MKNSVLLLAMIAFVFSLSSCEKYKEERSLPRIEFLKTGVAQADTLGIKKDTTITDNGYTYRLQVGQKGFAIITLLDGFPPEFIGEQMFSKEAYFAFLEKDPDLHFSANADALENWFVRNQGEGFNYPTKKMGMFLLGSSKSSFVYTNEAFMTWTAMTGPVAYYGESFYKGIPDEKIDPTDLRRSTVFCPIAKFIN